MNASGAPPAPRKGWWFQPAQPRAAWPGGWRACARGRVDRGRGMGWCRYVRFAGPIALLLRRYAPGTVPAPPRGISLSGVIYLRFGAAGGRQEALSYRSARRFVPDLPQRTGLLAYGPCAGARQPDGGPIPATKTRLRALEAARRDSKSPGPLVVG